MDARARESRGGLLAFVTAVANVYLALFAADAAIAVIDELTRVDDVTRPLSALRAALDWSVVGGTLLMLFVVSFVPQLPKILFAPLLGAVLWLALGAPPFTSSAHETQLFLALCQLLIAGLAFLYVHMTTGGLFLSAETLPRRSDVFLRIVAASFVTLTLIPALLVAFGLAAVASYAENETKGYLQFTWSDVRVRESIMRKGDKVVHLVATAHIAEGEFYRALYRDIPPNAVVLAEGISDRKKLLGIVGGTDSAADSLGLETQQVFETLLGPPVSETAVAPTSNSPPQPVAERQTRPLVVRADIDVSDLSETTLRCLKEDLKVTDSSFEELMQAEPATLQCTEADRKTYYNEILYRRNQKVLSEFDQRLARYDVFVVPWGALHMPDLEKNFKARGFKIERTRMLTLARYRTVAGRFIDGVAAYRMRGMANRPYRAR